VKFFPCPNCSTDIVPPHAYDGWQTVTCFGCMTEYQVKINGNEITVKGAAK